MSHFKIWNYVLIIAVAVILCYAPILKHEFINWDDDVYILTNKYITEFSWDNLKFIFSQQMLGNYHPFTLLSYAIDYQIGGLRPSQFLLSNIILHLINALLVFWFIFKLTNRKDFALITALAFAVHPLQVESVAWVAERKNLLSTLFFLASLILYLRYVQQHDQKDFRYSLILFLFSLLAKASTVSLVPTLLAVDFIYSRKLNEKKVWLEKWPFFLLAILFGVIALFAQHAQGATHYRGDYSFLQRIAFASYGYLQYIWKLVFPLHLSAIYPYPDLLGKYMPPWFWLYPVMILFLLGFFYKLYRHDRLAFFAVVFYSINIFLLLQLIPVGAAIMADRYAYIPAIGVFLLGCTAYDRLVVRGLKWQRVATMAIGAVIIAFAYLTIQRSAVWQNSLTFWDDVLTKYPQIFYGYNNRGVALLEKGRLEEAMADFKRAAERMPTYPTPHYNMGKTLAASKDYEGAIAAFDRAIAISPKVAAFYYERAQARMELQQYSLALADLDSVIALEPNHAEVWMLRGVARKRLGDIPGAIAEYDRGLQLNPRDANIYYNRGLAHFNLRLMDKAIADFSSAIKWQPQFADAYFSLGYTYQLIGQLSAAMNNYDRAIFYKPDFGKAYYYRGLVREAIGRKQEGLADRQRAIERGFQP